MSKKTLNIGNFIFFAQYFAKLIFVHFLDIYFQNS
jgi:hypothetical protein